MSVHPPSQQTRTTLQVSIGMPKLCKRRTKWRVSVRRAQRAKHRKTCNHPHNQRTRTTQRMSVEMFLASHAKDHLLQIVRPQKGKPFVSQIATN
jgi:hypothetical protein